MSRASSRLPTPRTAALSLALLSCAHRTPASPPVAHAAPIITTPVAPGIDPLAGAMLDVHEGPPASTRAQSIVGELEIQFGPNFAGVTVLEVAARLRGGGAALVEKDLGGERYLHVALLQPDGTPVGDPQEVLHVRRSRPSDATIRVTGSTLWLAWSETGAAHTDDTAGVGLRSTITLHVRSYILPTTSAGSLTLQHDEVLAVGSTSANNGTTSLTLGNDGDGVIAAYITPDSESVRFARLDEAGVRPLPVQVRRPAEGRLPIMRLVATPRGAVFSWIDWSTLTTHTLFPGLDRGTETYQLPRRSTLMDLWSEEGLRSFYDAIIVLADEDGSGMHLTSGAVHFAPLDGGATITSPQRVSAGCRNGQPFITLIPQRDFRPDDPRDEFRDDGPPTEIPFAHPATVLDLTEAMPAMDTYTGTCGNLGVDPEGRCSEALGDLNSSRSVVWLGRAIVGIWEAQPGNLMRWRCADREDGFER